MSQVGPEADNHAGHVHLTPDKRTPNGAVPFPLSAISDCERWQQTLLFDHLVGAREQGWRHFQAECFGVLMLRTVLYFVGACTGRSAGFSPFRCGRRRRRQADTTRPDQSRTTSIRLRRRNGGSYGIEWSHDSPSGNQAKADRAPRFPTMSDNRSSSSTCRLQLQWRLGQGPITAASRARRLGQVNSAGRDVGLLSYKPDQIGH
jgi:hypothetical protein